MIRMAWEKPFATCHNQESRHTRVLGNAFKIQYFGAIWSSLRRGLRFYQTRSHAVVLYDTLPAEFIEKAVCMKTKDQLYQKESSIPRLPRVVLKTYSQCGLQDLLVQEARSSWEPQTIQKLQKNLQQHCGLPNPRHITFNSETAGCKASE